jgi:hypothetical protein
MVSVAANAHRRRPPAAIAILNFIGSRMCRSDHPEQSIRAKTLDDGSPG